MKRWILALLVLLITAPFTIAAEPKPKRILFVGTVPSSRTESFRALLAANFPSVEVADRNTFRPARANGFDVVLLDWPQSEEARRDRQGGSPLGTRESWNHPTVLLGSAGLNIACAWKVLGGSGCTCLQPFAFNLREHPLFETPMHIARDQLIDRRVPAEFGKIYGKSIVPALSLVTDTEMRYDAGWASHGDLLEGSPEVEVMCGGINDQTPVSVAIWRQGNLTHFGFEQSPDEMNATGRDLLINTVCYAARFSEDRPIAITPSVFVDDNYPRTRSRVTRWVNGGNYEDKEMSLLFADPSIHTIAAAKAWLAENRNFARADAKGLLEVDPAAKRLSWTIGDAGGVENLIDRMEADPSIAPLLARYIPDGPGASASISSWRAWWKDHAAYAYFLDNGGYRFYLDSLAMKRGVPSATLRGRDREDLRLKPLTY